MKPMKLSGSELELIHKRVARMQQLEALLGAERQFLQDLLKLALLAREQDGNLAEYNINIETGEISRKTPLGPPVKEGLPQLRIASEERKEEVLG